MKICDSDAELARRMFIFSCFTGLAITDMEHLTFGHIKSAADGQMYIRKGASEDQGGVHCAVTPHCQDDYRAAKAATSGERRRQ